MILVILILLAIAIVLFMITKKIFELQKHVFNIVDSIESTVKHTEAVAEGIGTTAAISLLHKIRNFIVKKKYR